MAVNRYDPLSIFDVAHVLASFARSGVGDGNVKARTRLTSIRFLTFGTRLLAAASQRTISTTALGSILQNRVTMLERTLS